MKKDEFIEKMQELEHVKQKALEYNKKEVAKATAAYVAENSRLSVGDVVELADVRGTIESLTANKNGEISGEWRKTKKNGEPYTAKYRFFECDYECFKIITKAKK